jgi:hypothetical protein
MGLLDLPAPLFGVVDQALATFLPAVIRLALWGVLAGLLTMLVYRRLSNQERIQALKAQQKSAQREIADFDGELGDLFPLIRHALGLGMRQLGLALGPALLATIPVLFLLVWVAGNFGYRLPDAGSAVQVTAPEPPGSAPALSWRPAEGATATPEGWNVAWPESGPGLELRESELVLLRLPIEEPVPVIHKRQWWNLFMANPIGYLPDEAGIDMVQMALPQQQFLALGPGWMRGWMFTFFGVFLLSSIAFKIILKID